MIKGNVYFSIDGVDVSDFFEECELMEIERLDGKLIPARHLILRTKQGIKPLVERLKDNVGYTHYSYCTKCGAKLFDENDCPDGKPWVNYAKSIGHIPRKRCLGCLCGETIVGASK